MDEELTLSSNKGIARIAGLMYLIVVVTGVFNLAYVPSRLIDWNNARTTFINISENETLFRLGILSGITCYIAFLILSIFLYKLLSQIDKTSAVFMVFFSVVSVPISLINLNNKFAVLNLLDKASKLNGFELLSLQEQIISHLHLFKSGNQITSIFWGLWLYPLGYLVYKSGFLPKVLGTLLMFGCFGYIINFTGSFLFPNYYKGTFILEIIKKPGSSLGEMGFCLWLLIIGIGKVDLKSRMMINIKQLKLLKVRGNWKQQ